MKDYRPWLASVLVIGTYVCGIVYFAIHPPANHYPVVTAKVVHVGPIEEEGRKGTIRLPSGDTLSHEMTWDTKAGDPVKVTLTPDKPWLEGEEDDPNHPVNEALIGWSIFGCLLGIISLGAFQNYLVKNPRRRSRKPRVKRQVFRTIVWPWLMKPYYRLTGITFKRSKSYKHVKQLERELKRMSPTPNVVKAREKVQSLLAKLEARENERSEIIADTVDVLCAELATEERLRQEI